MDNFIKSLPDLPSQHSQIPVPQKLENAFITPLSDSSSQEFIDTQQWCNQEPTNISKVLKNASTMTTEYLNYELAQHRLYLSAHTSAIIKVLMTSDGQYIISASDDGTIRIWNFQCKTQDFAFKGHTMVIFSIAITSDDKYIVSGSGDKTVRIWNLKNKTQESVLQGHTRYVELVKITSDDLYIVSLSSDRTIRIWSFLNRMQEALIETLTSTIPHCLTLSSNSKYIVYPFQKELTLWNIPERRKEISFIRKECNDWVCISAMTRDNRLVACGYVTGAIVLWNREEKKQEVYFRPHYFCVWLGNNK